MPVQTFLRTVGKHRHMSAGEFVALSFDMNAIGRLAHSSEGVMLKARGPFHDKIDSPRRRFPCQPQKEPQFNNVDSSCAETAKASRSVELEALNQISNVV